MKIPTRFSAFAVAAIGIALAAAITIFFTSGDANRSQVVVYTSVDQIFSEPVFRRFEAQTGIEVKALFDTEETKSTGVLNRLIAEAAHPQADVFWSGDPVRPFLLMDRDLVTPYRSAQAAAIPSSFKAGDGRWTGFAARARVLLVNTERLGARTAPDSVNDLADPQWRGEAAMANPLFGTTTIHTAAWFSIWGEQKAKAFLNALKDNQVRIASSNGEVKRLVASGEITFGLTDTDDAFVALQSGAPVSVVYPDQGEGDMGALVMPTVVVNIRGGPNSETAVQLIDFLLSAEVETMMADSAAHIPLRDGLSAPEFVRSGSDLKAMPLDYADVAEQMAVIQPWLRQWAGL